METNQQNQDEIEIDLLELLRVLWSKIGYVILAALALGLLMVLVSKVFMKPQYEYDLLLLHGLHPPSGLLHTDLRLLL